MKQPLVCALMAHVDAGKTTLSEDMLYLSGSLRKAGRVDNGDTFLDTDSLERERGITIYSKTARLFWQDREIWLADTPGHADFSGEMERVLDVLDCAVLVLSAADGVQSHTMTVWKLLEKFRVPVLIFVNKMDRPDADRDGLMDDIRSRLSEYAVDMAADDADELCGLIDEESLAEYEKNGTVSDSTKRRLVSERKLFPCYFGSALRDSGVRELLDALCILNGCRDYPDRFGAKVFKIARDSRDTRLTFMKVTGGVLHARDIITYTDGGKEYSEKADRLLYVTGERYIQTETVPAGCLCAVTGLEHTRPGKGLGYEKDSPHPESEGVFTYRVHAPGQQAQTVLAAMQRLEEEDPLLKVQWIPASREIRAAVMGEVQLEVLTRKLKDRFSLAVTFDEGSILYKETIENTVEGVGHYEPLRHYAEVHLRLEPGERGSGTVFEADCPPDTLDRNWQRLILTHLYEKQHIGVLTGSPVTDIRVTLIAGKDHLKHTEGGDFRQATYRAVRNGLMRAKSVLLEPVYLFDLEVPQAQVGRAMTDLERMGARFSAPENAGEMSVIRGTVSVRKARLYPREVYSYTGGRGRMSVGNGGYEPCADAESVIRAIGYNAAADVENTADSVFCSHGAGFNVPWNKVREYMHLHTGLEESREGENLNAEAAPVKKSGGVKTTLEEDRELLEIFERTYGPVRSRAFDRPPRENVEVKAQEIDLHPEKLLLVDGYNVIFAWEELKKIAADSLDDARNALCEILCNFRGVRMCEIVVVFDAYRVKNNTGKSGPYRNITVVYTREAETADSYIEKAAAEAVKQPYTVRVVTGDRLEQISTMGHGALRTSSREFRKEVEQANIEIRRYIEQASHKSRGQPVLEAAERAVKKAEERNRKNAGKR